ncbi:MAG: hypothetical protein K8S16_07410 [Bacteroidales bacterium]|nr:hypothetical protein [Bacteroidales bacterium]
MKTYIIKNIKSLILIGVIIIVSSCDSAKYALNFKKDKKAVDTLTIISPAINIVAKSNDYEFIDSTLNAKNKELIEYITTQVLDSKYFLETQHKSTFNFNDLNKVFNQLDSSTENIIDISAKSLINNLVIEKTNRYALLIIYYGEFNPDFPPHYKLGSALGGTIVITPNTKTKGESDLRLLIIDTNMDKIVFYDRIISSFYDAREPYDIEQMTRKILKRIYYK